MKSSYNRFANAFQLNVRCMSILMAAVKIPLCLILDMRGIVWQLTPADLTLIDAGKRRDLRRPDFGLTLLVWSCKNCALMNRISTTLNCVPLFVHKSVSSMPSSILIQLVQLPHFVRHGQSAELSCTSIHSLLYAIAFSSFVTITIITLSKLKDMLTQTPCLIWNATMPLEMPQQIGLLRMSVFVATRPSPINGCIRLLFDVKTYTLQEFYKLSLMLQRYRSEHDHNTPASLNPQEPHPMRHALAFSERVAFWSVNDPWTFNLDQASDSNFYSYSYWGTSLMKCVLKWLRLFQWPQALNELESAQVRVSWMELVLSFMLFAQGYLPVHRPSNDTDTQFVWATTSAEAIAFSYSWNECATHCDNLQPGSFAGRYSIATFACASCPCLCTLPPGCWYLCFRSFPPPLFSATAPSGPADS